MKKTNHQKHNYFLTFNLLVFSLLGAVAYASEPKIAWEASVDGKRSFQVGPEGIHKTFNVTLNHVLSWDEDVDYQGICQVPTEIYAPVTYNDYECTAGSSDSNPLWNTYFQGPKEKKALNLANAIKGVGEKSAKALIANGYFHSKPNSWEDFKNELKTASENKIIQKSIYTAATTQYGAENLQNLGYTISSCQTIRKTEKLYIETIADVPCTKTRTETKKKIIDSDYRKAEILIVNPILQSFEEDTISFSVDSNGEMSVSGQPYTRYELSREVVGKTTNLTLTGVERNHIDLPSEALIKADLQPRGNGLEFSLTIDPKFVPALSKNSPDQLVVKYVVTSCQNGFGICAIFGRDEKVSETKYQIIKSSDILIPINIPAKRRAWITYSIQRRNSPYYNDKFSPSNETTSRTPNL